MRKIIFILIISIVLLTILTSCTVKNTTKQSIEYTTTEQPSPLLGPLEFSSEDEMVRQIKSGKITNSEHQLETISYYFRLKELPEGAKLFDIRVKAFYIALDYVIGNEEPDAKNNMITFVWYRTMFGEDMQIGFANSGISWKPMTKNSSYSFEIVENYAYNDKGEQDKSLPKIQECKMIMWVQDNHDFQVNAPLWFTEDDVQKYCIAEKVDVK
jgi:hypothetical protein